jgi:hypothetical protein
VDGHAGAVLVQLVERQLHAVGAEHHSGPHEHQRPALARHQAEAVAGEARRDCAQRLRLDLRDRPVELDRLGERRRARHPRQLAGPGPGRFPLRRPQPPVRQIARQRLQLGQRARRVGALDPGRQLVEGEAPGRAVFLQSRHHPLAILVRGPHGRAQRVRTPQAEPGAL